MLFLSVILTGREKINIAPLKSVWRDQTCEPIGIFAVTSRLGLVGTEATTVTPF